MNIKTLRVNSMDEGVMLDEQKQKDIVERKKAATLLSLDNKVDFILNEKGREKRGVYDHHGGDFAGVYHSSWVIHKYKSKGLTIIRNKHKDDDGETTSYIIYFKERSVLSFLKPSCLGYESIHKNLKQNSGEEITAFNNEQEWLDRLKEVYSKVSDAYSRKTLAAEQREQKSNEQRTGYYLNRYGLS